MVSSHMTLISQAGLGCFLMRVGTGTGPIKYVARPKGLVALGLLSSEVKKPKGHVTYNAPFFFLTIMSCSSSWGKILCFKIFSVEIWR